MILYKMQGTRSNPNCFGTGLNGISKKLLNYLMFNLFVICYSTPSNLMPSSELQCQKLNRVNNKTTKENNTECQFLSVRLQVTIIFIIHTADVSWKCQINPCSVPEICIPESYVLNCRKLSERDDYSPSKGRSITLDEISRNFLTALWSSFLVLLERPGKSLKVC